MTRLAEGVEQTYARKLQSVLGAAFDFVLLEFLQPGIHNLPILLSNTGQVLLTIWFRRLKISSSAHVQARPEVVGFPTATPIAPPASLQVIGSTFELWRPVQLGLPARQARKGIEQKRANHPQVLPIAPAQPLATGLW
ncbi:MAG: hypothetical protein DMG46_05580 [Acidobacteria bacterium]|nr:MAG: hypothetical protein DMG46_05580 [Acidobacteriota bacterium]